PFLPLQEDGKFPLIQFRVYASDKHFAVGKLEKLIDDFQLADPQDIEVNVTLPLVTRQNGTLYLYFVFLPNHTPEKVEHPKLPPVTHIRTVVNIMSLEDSPELSLPELPEIVLSGDENGYYPLLYVAELLNREKDLVEIFLGSRATDRSTSGEV
ncbi:hypothetical protein TELCIR_22975, partial [Teladorsagia circumcincta]